MLLTLMLTGGPAVAGTLDQPWKTVRTEHFRLHYPLEAEAWALESAAQLESIRERVSGEIGYAPEQIVDIVVMDPWTSPNGFAVPWLRTPRMGVFASPPPSDSVLGSYRSWEEDLIVHEDAHLVHLLQPSRNPWVRAAVGGTIGTGPIALKSPRWITEGYATVVEGRLTGMGRPNSDGRALLLRQLAQEGRLPTYEELDGSEVWRSGGYAYLVGSAFLEWLELRRGEGALRDLWTAMTAYKQRDLDASFEAVFGEDPATLYRRFAAEVTHDALEVEAARPVQQGTLWADLERGTGAPAVSPDGALIALTLQPEQGPAELVVWSTAENTEGEREWQEAVDKALERDPEDITPVRPPTFPREPVFKRVRPDRRPVEPRWTPDGDLLFTSWMRSGDGRMVPDLVLWTPGGPERRVTRGASVRDADPHPDSTRAVAIRQVWSASQLVWVDLETGEWTAITQPTVHEVLDHPRLSPDGTQIAYLRNAGEGWELVLREAAGGAERVLSLPGGAQPSQPAWAPGGDGLYVSLGLDGFVETWLVPLEGAPRPITATRGGAMAPAPTAEHLYFLSADADGYDLHRLELGEPPPPAVPAAASTPVLPPPPPPPIDPPERQEVSPKPYRLGGLSPSALVGATVSGETLGTELGLRLGDVAGRGTLHLAGAIDEQRHLSAAAGLAVRSLPLTLRLDGFAIALDGGSQRGGGELSLGRELLWSSGGAALRAGGWLDTPLGDDPVGLRGAGYGRAEAEQWLWLSRAWLSARIEGEGQLGATEGTPWRRGRAAGAAGGGYWPLGLELRGAFDDTTAEASPDLLVLGGIGSSLYPSGWASNQLFVPALADEGAAGSRHLAAGAALVTPWFLELEGRRDTLWTPRGDASELWSLGLAFDAETPAQPIFKISSARLRAGVAAVWGSGSEITAASLLEWDTYRYWLGITWRP